MNILVTGGAGYIGSHAVRKLLKENHKVIVIDNLSHSKIDQLSNAALNLENKPIFRNIDLCNTSKIKDIAEIIRYYRVEAIMHFAAFIEVGESVSNPFKYYSNNVGAVINLIAAMKQTLCNKIIFSSTAAVYGNPLTDIIQENQPTNPINPYGKSKLMCEEIIKDTVEKSDFIGAAILRYFNVAGVSPDGMLHECHVPETHLIPKIFTAANKNESISIFGNDFETHDGTCIRDYVHVDDLIDAHLLAMSKIIPSKTHIYNVGSQNGYSVKEVVTAVERKLNKSIDVNVVGRREGDPARLIADSSYIRNSLGWNPQYNTIDKVIQHII